MISFTQPLFRTAVIQSFDRVVFDAVHVGAGNSPGPEYLSDISYNLSALPEPSNGLLLMLAMISASLKDRRRRSWVNTRLSHPTKRRATAPSGW